MRSFVSSLVWLAAASLVLVGSARGQSRVGFFELHPFVTGLIPVVGPGGAVGGVSIDAQGIVARRSEEAVARLREARLRASQPIESDLQATSRMRKVSLRGLQAAIDKRRRAGLPISDELQNIAGLQRIQYVFAYPQARDIVLAGIAEGWKVDAQGNVVGRTTGESVLQLDDLVVALRTARAAATGEGITCSIDPTTGGLQRLQRMLNSRGLQINESTVASLEQALGPQQITLTGVAPSSHLAQVLVAADFMMKRLAMNLEPSPLEGFASYMKMLEVSSGPAPQNSAPRFWLAPRYEPLLKDADGLAWELRGTGVQALTEDGRLGKDGTVVSAGGKAGLLAQKWADAMTESYPQIAKALPIFGELRGCIDLAVVAALMEKENLAKKTGCDLSMLLDQKQLAVAEYQVPKTIDSRASLIRKGRSWIVSVSGGVEVDSWSVLNQVQTRGELTTTRSQAAPTGDERWWWD